MKTLTGILFGLLLLSASPSSSQTFYKEIGSASLNEGGTTFIQSPDGNYFVGGYKGDSSLVMKVDAFGNITWSRCIKLSTPSGLNSIFGLTVTPDNYLLGVGNVWNTSSLTRAGSFLRWI